MKGNKKADSTEKLLDIIRDGEGRQLNHVAESADDSGKALRKKPRTLPRKRNRSGFSFRISRVCSIGVDIREDSINLIKTSSGDYRRRIQAVEQIPIDHEQGIDSDGFVLTLRSALANFTRGCKNFFIWGLLRSGDVDVNIVRVPRVPSSRLDTTVYWQLKKDKKFEEKDYILDYRSLGNVRENGVPKHEVLTCLGNRQEVNRIRDLFEDAGFPLTGLIPVSVAIENIYRTNQFSSGSGLTANIHLDWEFSCITILSAGRIQFSRTIKTGISSMVDELVLNLNEAELDPDSPVDHMDASVAQELLLHKLLGVPLRRNIPGLSMTRKDVFETISPVLQRIVRQAERTLDYFFQNFKQRCERLHLSGQIFANKKVSEYVGSQLGLPHKEFDPLGRVDSPATLSLADSTARRMGLIKAFGLSLSDKNQTINFIHNYQARRIEQTNARLSDIVAVAAMVLALVLAGGYVWLMDVSKAKNVELAELQTELRKFPDVDEVTLTDMADEVVIRQEQLRVIGHRYETLAVLNELAALTPGNVKFLSVSLDMGKNVPEPVPVDPDLDQVESQETDQLRLLVIEAVILGERDESESALTRLLLGIKASEIFSDTVIHQKDIQEFVPEGDVLHIVLHVGLA